MIKAVIFDLDGVLVDATEWHYEALNNALALFGFNIDRNMHFSEYNGLPTKEKLKRLSNRKGFPLSLLEFTNEIPTEPGYYYVLTDQYPVKVEIIDAGAVSTSYDGTDTTASYIVQEDDFIIVGDFSAEIVFYTASVYEDSTETYRWVVTASGDA